MLRVHGFRRSVFGTTLLAVAVGGSACSTSEPEQHTTSIVETHVAYTIESIQCPSPDDLRKALNITSRLLITRQQGAAEVSCLVEIPHSSSRDFAVLREIRQQQQQQLPRK